MSIQAGDVIGITIVAIPIVFAVFVVAQIYFVPRMAARRGLDGKAWFLITLIWCLINVEFISGEKRFFVFKEVGNAYNSFLYMIGYWLEANRFQPDSVPVLILMIVTMIPVVVGTVVYALLPFFVVRRQKLLQAFAKPTTRGRRQTAQPDITKTQN